MKLKQLLEMGPWEWPEDARQRIADTLRNDRADAAERLIAAELAGDFTLIDDEYANMLLDILHNGSEPEDLRATAAIAMGPGLETMYISEDELGDGDLIPLINDEIPFSMEMYRRIMARLGELYWDDEAPLEVRRRALETSVRAPQDWHREAVRAAYDSEDDDWRLTAVFSMEYIRGFDEQILEALESGNELIRYHAVCAAGNWEVEGAWPHITDILDGGEADRDLLLAAIKAAATIRPNEASLFIGDYLDSDDDEIVDTAHEAIGMAEGLLDAEDDEDAWDGDEDDDPVH